VMTVAAVLSPGALNPLALLLAKEDLEVRFEGAPAPYVIFAVAVGIIAFVAITYILEPRGDGRSRTGRIFLACLRVAAILLAVGILFRPVERKETREVKDGFVVIAIDKSRSMSLKDREGDEGFKTKLAQEIGAGVREIRDMDRLTRVKKALTFEKKKFLERLCEKNRVKLYSFDAARNRLADVAKVDRDAKKEDEKGADEKPDTATTLARARIEINGIEADGPATALGESLQKILTDLRSEKVAALVLLTDGRSNAGALQARDVAVRYGKKSIPIYAIGVGDPNPPKDLAVENLEAPEVSIAGDQVRFMFLARAQGYEQPRETDIDLVIDGNQAKRERVTLGGDKVEVSKSMVWKFDKEGEFNVEIRIPPDEAEITTENNKLLHRIRIINQKIKVLYIEGQPRWEYRFLKNALVRDSKIEVQCLLLSAEPGFNQETTKGVPPLRGFPTREELMQYHVVILGDVNPAAKAWDRTDIFPDGTWENLKEFVGDQGGGLLIISGESDMPRRYATTALAPLLPVVIDEDDGRETRDFSESFHPRLTREGMRSDILRLEADEERWKSLWEGPNALPGLRFYVRVQKVKPLAHVLAEHPNDRNQNGNYPIWAWHYYKSGKVFWSANDETWLWHPGVGDRYSYGFYQRVLRDLATGRLQRSKRFLVTTDKTKYVVGEEARIGARVLDRSFKPGTEKTQEVIVERPDAQTEKLELKLIEGRPGNYEGRFKPVKMGHYKVSIDPGSAGSEADVVSKDFEVKFPSIELEEPRMDQETLKAIAEASGGQFLKLDAINEIPERIPPLAASANERELWDNSWILAIFAALLIVEWVGRRVARLL
jgi:uncharacterized membrane protein